MEHGSGTLSQILRGGCRDMNTEAMARAYLEDASYSLREAREALSAKRYHRVVRRAQESVELSLKAALRLLAV